MVDEAKLSVVLSDFAWTLATDFPIQSILDHLVQRIVEVLPITAAGMTLISERLSPRYIAASDASALRFEQLQSELEQGPCVAAYTSGEAVAVPDLRSDLRFPCFAPAAVAEGLAAVFTFPLRRGDQRFGALDLYRDSPGELGPRDMDVAQTLANVTAAYVLTAESRADALAHAGHYRQVSLHDGLTGLPNRLLLQERMKHAAQRAQRSRLPAAVLFVDLDRFKRVNDTHGHRVGDALLLAIADRLSQVVRVGDTVARVSGDEFVFLCEELASAADADLIVERVHEAFARPFFPAGIEVHVSASVGVAFAGAGQLISERLITQADTAMYRAKRRGRTIAAGCAEGRPERQQIGLLREGDPAAADLPDNAIQRLCAAGLSVEEAASALGPGPTADRLHDILVQLDDTIAQIRPAICALDTATS